MAFTTVTLKNNGCMTRCTVRNSSLISHFNTELTRSAWYRSFKFVDPEESASTTDLQVESFSSGFISIPRTSNVLKASDASSRLKQRKPSQMSKWYIKYQKLSFQDICISRPQRWYRKWYGKKNKKIKKKTD